MPVALGAAFENWVLMSGLLRLPWANAIDYRIYRAAAHIGLTAGWSHIYDERLQRAAIAPLWPQAGWPSWWTSSTPFWSPFVSPPPVAWLAAPLNVLPAGAAAAVWTVAVGLALVLIAVLIAPSRWSARLRYGSLLVLTWASVLAVVSGNVVVLVGLAIVVAWRLMESGHEVLAGAVLGLATLKPQVMFAIPLLLLALGWWRAASAAAAVALILAALSLATLGSAGLHAYVDLVRTVGAFSGEQHLSLARISSSGAIDAGLVAGALLLFGVAAWTQRARGPGVPLALGLLASLAASPYLNTEDFVLIVVAAMLVLRVMPEAVVAVPAVALALSATLASQSNVGPSLVLMSLVAGAFIAVRYLTPSWDARAARRRPLVPAA